MTMFIVIAFVILLILLIVFIVLYALQRAEHEEQEAVGAQNPGLTSFEVIAPFVKRKDTLKVFDENSTKRILCIGDSVTEVGSGGLGGYGTYPYQLATFANVSGCSEAFIGSHISDPRFVLSNPSTMVTNLSTLGGFVVQLSDPSDNLLYNPTMKTMGYTLWLLTGPDACDVQVTLSTTLFGSNGATTQAPQTLNCYRPSASPALTAFTVRSTAATKEAYYLSMKAVTASGRSAKFVGLEPINAPGVNLSVINGGLSGTTSNDIAVDGQVYSPLSIVRALQPDLSIVMVGINDWYIAKTSLVQFTTNLRAIYSAAMVSGGQVLVMTPVPTSTAFVAQATQDAYVEVIRDLADELNLPLLDLYGLWQSYGKTDIANWMKDALHPNERGIQEMVNAIRYTINV